MANSLLKTNLNTSPYYDDYDEDKGFHRILFRPSVAVQSRELTQLQTILQNQIQKMGSYNFKDGAIIDGCAIIYNTVVPYVVLSDEFTSNTELLANSVNSSYLITNSANSTTAVRATIKQAKNGYLSQYPNANRWYLDYISTGKDGSNNDVIQFSSGDTLNIYTPDQAKHGTLDANNLFDTIDVFTANATANSTGVGYGVSVSDGVVYQKGFFINVDSGFTLVKEFDTNPNNYVVGFETTESIVTPDQDTSLKDVASGSPNPNAPGAHRLKLNTELVAKERTDTSNNKNFFAIVEFESTLPTEQNTGEEGLNKTLDVLANRTKEESGDYVVSPFHIESFSHYSNSSLFQYEIGSGIGYFSGYRKEKINPVRVDAERATTTREAEAQIATANYGNYVYVNELSGTFDADTGSTVDLYDTAQNSISDYEGSDPAATGTKVGEAKVRAVIYDTGIKGTPTGKYRMYLYDISMNSGTSFANDVKAIYSSAVSEAKADIVLESGNTAQLKDANRNVLVWDLGVRAVKHLRDSGGGNDTQFVFRDRTSATMATDGTVTFTINSPANGGVEKLNHGTGSLSTAQLSEYNITLADSVTTDATGTVDCTGTTTLVGTGTTFDTEFQVGELIRVDDGSSTYVRKIESIANGTQITIDADISSANAVASIEKYYVPGQVLDFGLGGGITINSNTQFTVDSNMALSGTLSSTVTAYVEYPVLRTDAVETKKEVSKYSVVKIDCSNNTNTSQGPFNLGVVDLSKVRGIYVGTDYANTNPNRLSWFSVSSGQTDQAYEHGFIALKSAFKNKLSSSTRILVEFDNFEANTTPGVGFFSVDSYPVDDANTSNATAITTSEIPRYYSNINQKFMDLRDSIDFRPRRFNTATITPTIGSATVNPAAANSSFNTPVAGTYLVEPDSNFQADLEYYLPRKDIILMNKEGDVTVKTGVPDENPVTPTKDSDTSILARAYVSPFPSLTVREADLVDRRDIAIKTRSETNRGYTMRDIGILDSRITRMEYYATLNMLEQKAKDVVITDENGLDRFKNGIFANPFQSHIISRIEDFEYNIAVDIDQGLARPKFVKHDVDFIFDTSNSSGVVQTGPYVSLAFSNTIYQSQRFATKYRNCVESVWQWNGLLNIYPDYDHHQDETLMPNIDVDIDLAGPWEDFANSAFGTRFGDWRTTSTSSGNIDINEGTRTRVTTSEQIIEQINVDVENRSQDLGEYVTDITTNPYIRSREVALIANGLKPNTRMYVHFDRQNVNDHCAPASQTANTLSEIFQSDPSKILTRDGEFGDALTTDSVGTLNAILRIPSGTFRVGEREIIVNDVDDLVTGSDASLSVAMGTYVASSISVGKQGLTLNTRQPQFTVTSNTSTRVQEVTVRAPNPPAVTTTPTQIGEGNDNGNMDPISQSFLARVPDATSGMFLSQIGVFFRSKSSDLGVEVWLVETTTGLPDSKRIIAKGRKEAADITVDASSAAVETVFNLNYPVFLENEKEYAFAVKPDGNSPDYEIWCAEVGEYDVTTEEQVYSNPASGVMFISANFNTWTPIQTEDIKYNLYRADFTSSSGTAMFQNEDDDYLTVDGFSLANTDLRLENGDVIVKLDGANSRVTDSANAEYSTGIIQSYDDSLSTLYLDKSTGNFAATDVIEIHRPVGNTSNLAQFNSNTLVATSTIESVDNLLYHMTVPRFATMQPSRTKVEYEFKGTSSSYVTDGAYLKVRPETETEFTDIGRIAASKSNEEDNMSGAKSSFFKLDLASTSSYVSPIIDLRRKSSLFIENIINNDATDEHTRYGNAETKYISPIITLDDDLGDAEDLNAYVGGYRPSGTDIKVYVKVLGSEDGDNFDDKLWTEMEKTPGSELLYSAPLDRTDYREFEYRIPTSNSVAVGSQTDAYLSNGFIQYTRTDGSIVVGYKSYAFKIVLLSEDPVRVPILNDFRSMALQK